MTLILARFPYENWIHIGSEQADPRVAAIVSVVETCRRFKIPVRDYLCSIFAGLTDCPINRTSGARFLADPKLYLASDTADVAIICLS